MSHDESSIGFSSCRTRLTQNEQVLPEFLCNILRLKLWQSRGPTNPGWQLALNVQIFPNKLQKTSRKRYIFPRYRFVSFFPLSKIFGLGFWSSQRNPSLSWFPRNTRRAELARNFFFPPPRIFPPSSCGGQLDGARGLSKRASLSGEFLEVCGIDSLGGGFIFFFSPLLGDNDPNWLIFFRWVETTNQFSFEGFSLNKWEVLRTFSSGCHGDFQKGSVMWFQKDLYKQHKEVDYFSLVEWNRLGGNWWKGM